MIVTEEFTVKLRVNSHSTPEAVHALVAEVVEAMRHTLLHALEGGAEVKAAVTDAEVYD